MKKIDVYLHGSKESLYDVGKKAGLSERALSTFMYACTEVKLSLEVEETTGEATITRIDDQMIMKP